MCVCTHVLTCVCTQVLTCVCTHVVTCVCTHLYTCVYVCTHAGITSAYWVPWEVVFGPKAPPVENDHHLLPTCCMCTCVSVFYTLYCMARNFGGKNIWRIALIMAFGRFYFGSWVSLIP